jgi:hypothetical protein
MDARVLPARHPARLAMVSLPAIEQVTVTLESASTFLDHRLGMSSRARSACATKSQCEFQRRTSNARRSTSRAIGGRRDAPLSIDPSVRARGPARCAPIETSLCQGLRRRCGEERSDEELGAWRAWALGLLVAREWLFRRAGDSGCEPVTLDAESFPDCPPGSLPRPFGTGRAASLIIRL